MSDQERDQELAAIHQRYARREDSAVLDRYSLLRPEVWQMLQERQRAMLKLLARRQGRVADWRLTEVGCGAGGNLLELLRLGFAPEHLNGIELLTSRFDDARSRLPASCRLHLGDASQAPIDANSQDLVLQFTVFSSILSDAVQQSVADAMWRWLKPGGAVLWYDFTINNPRNADVRGVPMSRVRTLFPQARINHQRLTLAPPLARAVCRLHPVCYTLFNSLPVLRTHVLACIEKPL